MRAIRKINPKKPKHSKESLYHDNVLHLLEILGRNYPNFNVIETTKAIVERVHDDNVIIDKICKELLKQRYDLKDNIRNEAITILATIRSTNRRKEETRGYGLDATAIKNMRLVEKMTIGQIAQKMRLPYTTIQYHTRKNGWN